MIGTAEKKYNNFSILKFLAAIMVITGHMKYILNEPVLVLFGQGIQSIGMRIFFLTGGYLIAKSWLSDPRPLRYATKRIMRIIPPLIGYVLFAIVFSGIFLTSFSVEEYFRSPYTWRYLKNIVLCIEYTLPGVFVNNPYPNAVNGSLWSLPVEVALYILVPFVLWLFHIQRDSEKGKSFLLITTVFLCIINIICLCYFPQLRVVFYQTDWIQALHLMPYYFIGMLYAFPSFRKRLNLQLSVLLICCWLCFDFKLVGNEVMLCTVFPYFIFSFALVEKPYFSRVFQKYDISYGMFLYGFFIQQIVTDFLVRNNISFGGNLCLLLCIVITILFAFFSYVFIERPMQCLNGKILSLMKKA